MKLLFIYTCMFVLGLDVKIIYVDHVKNVKATLDFECKIILSEKTF